MGSHGARQRGRPQARLLGNAQRRLHDARLGGGDQHAVQGLGRPDTLGIGGQGREVERGLVGGDLREMVRLNLDGHLPFAADERPSTSSPLPAEPEGARRRRDPAARAGRRRRAARRRVGAAHRRGGAAAARPRSPWPPTTCWRSRSPERGRRVVWVHRTGPTADVLCLLGPALVLSRTVPAADDAAVADEVRRSLGRRALARLRRRLGLGRPDPGRARAGPVGAPATAPAYTSRAQARLAALPPRIAASTSWRWPSPAGRRGRARSTCCRRRCGRAGSRAPQAITLGLAAVDRRCCWSPRSWSPAIASSATSAAINAEIARLEPAGARGRARGARARAQAQAAGDRSPASRTRRCGRCPCCAS